MSKELINKILEDVGLEIIDDSQEQIGNNNSEAE